MFRSLRGRFAVYPTILYIYITFRVGRETTGSTLRAARPRTVYFEIANRGPYRRLAKKCISCVNSSSINVFIPSYF